MDSNNWINIKRLQWRKHSPIHLVWFRDHRVGSSWKPSCSVPTLTRLAATSPVSYMVLPIRMWWHAFPLLLKVFPLLFSLSHSGTGKTVTGVHIAYWFAQRNQRLTYKVLKKDKRKKEGETAYRAPPQLIYCGPSNKAVDVVTGQFCQLLRWIKRIQSRKSWHNVRT